MVETNEDDKGQAELKGNSSPLLCSLDVFAEKGYVKVEELKDYGEKDSLFWFYFILVFTLKF